VRTLNELLINRLRIGFMRMERIIKDRMSTIEAIDLAPMQLINPRPVIAVIKEFFPLRSCRSLWITKIRCQN